MPFLVLVMLIARDRRVMSAYANGPVTMTLGWATVVLMALAAVALFVTF